MEKNVEQFLLNRVSLSVVTIATASLLYLFFHFSISCSSSSSSSSSSHRRPAGTTAPVPFPRSSCEVFARGILPPDKRFARLRSSSSWRLRVNAFAALFEPLRHRPSAPVRLLSNSSRVLCVYAGAGHEVAAFQDSGVQNVTGVDVLDFPPLVSRADPHNLPFSDSIFDLGFSAGVTGALFPARFASELERTVRWGGAIVLAVDAGAEVETVRALFKRSSLVELTVMEHFTGDHLKLIYVDATSHLLYFISRCCMQQSYLPFS